MVDLNYGCPNSFLELIQIRWLIKDIINFSIFKLFEYRKENKRINKRNIKILKKIDNKKRVLIKNNIRKKNIKIFIIKNNLKKNHLFYLKIILKD